MSRLTMLIALACYLSFSGLATASCMGDACVAKPDEQSLLQVQSQVSNGARVGAKSQMSQKNSAKSQTLDCKTNDQGEENSCEFEDTDSGQVKASWSFPVVDQTTLSYLNIQSVNILDAEDEEEYKDPRLDCKDLIRTAVEKIEARSGITFDFMQMFFGEAEKECTCYAEAAEMLGFQLFRYQTGVQVADGPYRFVEPCQSKKVTEKCTNYGLTCQGFKGQGRPTQKDLKNYVSYPGREAAMWGFAMRDLGKMTRLTAAPTLPEEQKEEAPPTLGIGGGKFIRWAKHKFK